ncbi:MAG: hypothetical protein MJZ20_05555 [Bacteroidaceae bacterium]|nr:hypothetical protein [Bacteroidaceae bacterium]
MKSKDCPTKSQMERMNQLTFQTQIDCMSDNLAVTLIVLNQYFGFGEKRIRYFLESTRKEVERFNAYKDDGIARDKAVEALAAFGIDADEIYEKVDFMLYEQYKKVEKRKAVSVKEANDMQEALKLMKSLQFAEK